MKTPEKQCTRCSELLLATSENFYRDRSAPDGFEYRCKNCRKEAQKTPEAKETGRIRMAKWRELNKEKDAANARVWRENNRDKTQAATRRYDASDHGKKTRSESQKLRREATNKYLRDTGWYSSPEQKARKAKWRDENREKVRKYSRKANKPLLRKLKLRYLCRIYSALHSQGLRKTQRMIQLVGCTTAELREHIELQFRPGMSWSAYLEGKIHIDHIRPCCSFDLADPIQLTEAFHYSNLRPLWANENLVKAPSDRKLSIRRKKPHKGDGEAEEAV